MNEQFDDEAARNRHPSVKRQRGRTTAVFTALLMLAALLATTAGPAAALDCPTDAEVGYEVDSDDDGWGWIRDSSLPEGGKSCIVVSSTEDPADDATPESTDRFPGTPTCPSNAEGDRVLNGWGYVRATRKSCIFRTLDFGDPADSTSSGSNVPTDDSIVILFAGQSNSIGTRNGSADATDSVSGNAGGNTIYVLPAGESSFVVANLCTQNWHAGLSTPVGGNGAQPCGNHPGYQMAKKVAEQANQDVFLIPTGQDGMPIEQWIGNSLRDMTCLRNNIGFEVPQRTGDQEPITFGKGMNEIRDRVGKLNGVEIDVVGWVQGEANGDPRSSRYQCKLLELMADLDDVPSINFGSGTRFIATQVVEDFANAAKEPGMEGVNQGIREAKLWSSLGAYPANASWYSYIDARFSDVLPDEVHYTDNGMRDIGQKMANEFCNFSATSVC